MSLNINSHKKILVRILKDIFTDTRIGPILGFKGGSAAGTPLESKMRLLRQKPPRK